MEMLCKLTLVNPLMQLFLLGLTRLLTHIQLHSHNPTLSHVYHCTQSQTLTHIRLHSVTHINTYTVAQNRTH